MSLGEGSCFSLFSGKHKDLVQLFLDNNVGGPALIFDRKAVVGMYSYIYIFMRILYTV